MTQTPTLKLRLNRNWTEIELLYLDDHLLAINKPAGLLTVPDRWDAKRDNLVTMCHQAIREGATWAKKLNISYMANAHRLDFQTSGVILFARQKPTLVMLARMFNDHKIHKRYLAIINGIPTQDELKIDLPIAPHPTLPGLVVIDGRYGKQAQSVIRLVEHFRNHALVEVEPLTGRQHQIRIHLQSAGLPLVADSQYGDGHPLLLSRMKPYYKVKAAGEKPLLARPALHAASIEFIHPVTQQPVKIEAPLAKDMTVALKYLRKFG